MLIDTHAHLNFPEFDKDLDEVIQKAHEKSVKYFIVPGVDQKTNEKSIELAIKYPFMKAAVGIHPLYFLNENPLSIEQYLKLPQVVAIGEIGLDLYHDKNNLEIQQKNLEIQIQLALKYKLPVILHAREAFEETYKMLSPYKGQIEGVFHCLTSDFQEAQKAVDLGFYVGLGGIVTYDKALEAHKIAKHIPLDRILLETDAPFLTPAPLAKNLRNEPQFIKNVVEKIASIKNISLEELSKQTTNNAKKLFNLNF
ncbi:TatD family hydrolase ['Camptotheca acuminata' phytoplasma]|uniref:TatD family hydrolase n=1 Tax='Camptotheca acuminata' phytoplasma TaxID=3239192 RepID=UPI00351A28C9